MATTLSLGGWWPGRRWRRATAARLRSRRRRRARFRRSSRCLIPPGDDIPLRPPPLRSPGAGEMRTMPRVQQANLPWSSNELTSLQGTHRVHADAGVRGRRGTPTTSAPLRESATTTPTVGIAPASTRTPMLLTVRDVEAELQLGRTRTYELLRSGSIPVIRVGRALRVPRDALRRWVDEQTG